MFYSTELLSLRRKGKLARCWLAATVSEKMFKKFCKPNLISKIDVYRICEEILVTVEIRDRRSYGRFSLYLSSQLMYGVTKILFYQTKIFQDYLFCMYRKLLTIHRNDIRKFRWDNSEEAIEESKMQVPLVDIDQFQIDVIETEEEKRLASARRDQRESLIAVEGGQLKKLTPPISKKRSLKYSDEVATKRRKISPEEKTPPVLAPLPETVPGPIPEPVPEPIPELLPEPVPIPEQQEQAQQNLEREAIVGLTKTKKKRKFSDKETKLSDTVMQSWIRNISAHTIKHPRFATTLPSVMEYIMQPSVMIFNKSRGRSLIKLFEQHLIGPFVAQNEYEILDFEIEDTIHGETIRADISSKIRDQTAEISSKLAITTTDTTDQSKTLEKIPPINGFQPKLSDENHITEMKEGQEPIVELPDITDIEHKIRESSVKLEKLNGRKSESTSVSSETRLTKHELLALMEVQWHEKGMIKFEDIISPESYSKKDAARAFSLCLEFHKEKVVILKQAECFCTIWIEKYPCYSSGTDENTAAS
nr:PREDICTED: uncharacterized protein LOC100875607 isoform X1 [Megachile rotundata]